MVHIRRQNRNSHALAFADEDGNFFSVVNFVAQQTGHEFDRIMRFQISRLITDHAIGCAVALVESVAGKFFEQIENRVRFFLRDFVCVRAAFDEILSLLRHLLLVFFAHGAAEKVGLA